MWNILHTKTPLYRFRKWHPHEQFAHRSASQAGSVRSKPFNGLEFAALTVSTGYRRLKICARRTIQLTTGPTFFIVSVPKTLAKRITNGYGLLDSSQTLYRNGIALGWLPDFTAAGAVKSINDALPRPMSVIGDYVSLYFRIAGCAVARLELMQVLLFHMFASS